MKKFLVLSLIVVTTLALNAAGQAPAGGQGRGGGSGQGRGGGRGAAPAPPATGPIADKVNEIVATVNKADSAALQKFVTPDTLWADEDGHILPANIWIGKLTTGVAKKLSISNLRVANWENAGWAAFNYVLEEGATTIRGTNTLVFNKAGGDWQVVLVHEAINTNVGAH